MENERKRRIDTLVEHFEQKLNSKRQKLNVLQNELLYLEYDPTALQPLLESTPISSRRSSAIFSASRSTSNLLNESTDVSVNSSFESVSSSSPVVPLSLSPSRKSSRLSLGHSPRERHLIHTSKKEASVLARVAQLQKQGKWVPKKLVKLQLPSKPKTHWDYVLEEMTWMSGVFQQEMKMKKSAAKKSAKMVQKHFTDKALAVQRAERAHEQNLRKISSFMAREVRGFWSNIEKLFQFRIKSQIEKKRKIALDEHLNFIVDKTEKYSSLLAESLAESASLKTTPAASDSESVGKADDDEYLPDQNSDDDEGTIAKDEDAHEDDELDLLKAESDIPVEELLRLYHPELYADNSEEADAENQKSAEAAPDGLGDSEKLDEDSKSKSDETAQEGEEDADDEGEDDDQGQDDQAAESGLEVLVNGSEEKFSDVIEMAAKFQPTGNTLDTTSVKTKIPFLLRGTLREYQHIGLDWLVSLQERKLNGILADEMGLGKTIQTISLLLHLACEKHVWGPHLIVVPTSVMLNWEMELKKWAPAFKVLTYYGSQKERRMKRVGWTKQNAFHVCITSYKLVIQDHQSFRRKRWYYLILDEAQHIKNFKSQRWQLLLNFASEARLLLTGTPLQNNLMELWSLMHFLMPNVFESHRDFKEWFSNPLTGMVEGSAEYNEGLIQRLHKVLRPFLLRRLKNEVEKQLPKKYEHVVKCPLSKRQRFLYDDFMSRAKTKETLQGGNLLSVINVLMQLRKVCNHPNLFEPRPTVAPFVAETVTLHLPNLVTRALAYEPLKTIDLSSQHRMNMGSHEFHLTAYASHWLSTHMMTSSQFENAIIKGQWKQYVPCPRGKLRLTIRTGSSPPTPKEEMKIPLQVLLNNNLHVKRANDITIRTQKGVFLLSPAPPLSSLSPIKNPPQLDGALSGSDSGSVESDDSASESDHVQLSKKKPDIRQNEKNLQRGIFSSTVFKKSSSKLSKLQKPKVEPDFKAKLESLKKTKVDRLFRVNSQRCSSYPLYGEDLLTSLKWLSDDFSTRGLENFSSLPASSCFEHSVYDQSHFVSTKTDIVSRLEPFVSKFQLYVSPCVIHTSLMARNDSCLVQELSYKCVDVMWNPVSIWASQISRHHMLQLPETRLIQYDCGKLQVLGRLLHQLKEEGHRVLIFTQMTKVLDVLESFMNYQGHTYLRLDGSTKIEQRQILMERFNANAKYFCFILSTRSGGVGVNLTGADTVIFYDSDWNPTMDAQAQDRCHRIGQTRDVHIYRLVSEKTIEENILKKANQKRLLGDLAIEGGNFTTAHFKKSTIRDLFDVSEETRPEEFVSEIEESEEVVDDGVKKKLNIFESALTAVEENTDVEALKIAHREAEDEEAEFNEEGEREDDQFGHLLKQLSAVERYALTHFESQESEWKKEQLAAADAQIEAQRKEFDARRLEELAEKLENRSMSANTTTDESSDESDTEDGLASPRTRSRGDIDINLWKLDKSQQS